MTERLADTGFRISNGWRIAGWGAAAALLALPAIAMQFTGEVDWTPGDFIAAAILLIALGTGLEIAVRVSRGKAQLVGMFIAAFTGFFTMWSNGAVGIIGNEAEPVNLGFYALVFAAVFASLAVWFRPRAMQWIMGLVAIGQPAHGIAALWLMPGHAVEWGFLAVLAGLWGAAALCFRKACAASSTA